MDGEEVTIVDGVEVITPVELQVKLPDARLTILETDARYQRAGFEVRGQGVLTFLDDADEVSVISGATAGERQLGLHVEGAYDLLRLLAPDTDHRLHLFYRHAWVDLQNEVPSGFEANPAGTYTQHTVGLAWFPIDQVVAKIDFQMKEDDADKKSERLNAAVGFSF